MQENLEFVDHRQKGHKISKIILFLFSLVSALIFIPVIYMILLESNTDTMLILIFIIPSFLFFSILPIVLFKFVTGKAKKTIFLPSDQKIQFFEGKSLLSEIEFGKISSLKQSKYTYTVKTKNGTSTVTVYTAISPELPDSILAESTNFIQTRMFAEKIAKLLKISLTNEEGLKREYHELDIPFHKRNHPEIDLFTPPKFSAESNLQWLDTGAELRIISTYNPLVFRIVGICLSVALFLIIQLALGDLLNLSIFSWESFPPTIPEIIFSLIGLAIAFLPVGFAYYNGYRKKTIIIKKEGIYKDKSSILFEKLEEIIQDEYHLSLIGDDVSMRIPLFLFCRNEDYNSIRQALVYGILNQTNATSSVSFETFRTEF